MLISELCLPPPFFLVWGVAAFDAKNRLDENKTEVIQLRTNKTNLQKNNNNNP